MLWPFLDLTVDYQGFYRSTDRWPAVVVTITAGIVLGIDLSPPAKRGNWKTFHRQIDRQP